MSSDQDVRELRDQIATLKEKFSSDVNEAFRISRELHQKQSLLLSKLEFRIESLENLIKQAVLLLHGDRQAKGVLARLELLEQADRVFVESNQTKDTAFEALQAKVDSLHNLHAKVKEIREDQARQAKDISEIKEARAKVAGGWYVLGVVSASFFALLAAALQLWRVFGQ